MELRKSLTTFAILATLTASAAGSSFATSISVAATSDRLGGSGTAATFTGGPGGTLYVPSTPGTAGIPVVITFDPTHSFNAVFTFSPTSATDGAAPASGGKFGEDFTGGTFSFDNGATNYLSGSYLAGVLAAAPGGTTADFQSAGANEVTYTGGTFLGLAGLNPGDIGAFSLSLSGADSGGGTGINITGGFIQQFIANGFSGTFSAFKPNTPPSTPEPGSIVALTMGALALAGLTLRARRVSAL